MAGGGFSLFFLLLSSLCCHDAALVGEEEDSTTVHLGGEVTMPLVVRCVEMDGLGCCWENFSEVGLPDEFPDDLPDDLLDQLLVFYCEIACVYNGYMVGEYHKGDDFCCCT